MILFANVPSTVISENIYLTVFMEKNRGDNRMIEDLIVRLIDLNSTYICKVYAVRIT